VSITGENIVWNPGTANGKQRQFFQSRALYTCYGGAKGGGKTWAVRTKAIGGAIANPGIRILIMRAHYTELEMNHIRPIRSQVPPEIADYNSTSHIMTFFNGSFIKFGHWSNDDCENEYNGQEYDWIFIDEATQFTERAFNFLCGCLRGVSSVPKRMYLTCNPGGVGHNWVKRLFIDRNFRTLSPNAEENENPEDYAFIFATVEDNTALLESSPGYLRALSAMPNAKAYRYGDWSSLSGCYFKEFSRRTHVFKPFPIPSSFPCFRSFDYGFDMFACMWWAIDTDGRVWCYRSYEKSDLNVSQAAEQALAHTLPDELISATYAPPDMWSRIKESGRTMAELFAMSGLPIVQSSNNRVQGHMLMRNMLLDMPLRDGYIRSLFAEPPDKLPGLMFFDGVGGVIEDMESIQADETDPNDCAKQPHKLTHTVDAVRYFCVSGTPAVREEAVYEDGEYFKYLMG